MISHGRRSPDGRGVRVSSQAAAAVAMDYAIFSDAEAARSRLADAGRNDGHCRREEKCRSDAGGAGCRREVVSAL